MSKYTTGEIAKLCHVSVRTVQYYDRRNILTPAELSEGGRRLYSEQDLSRMKIICFLKDTGLPLNSIAQLLSEEDPGSIISVLLEQQKKELESEIAESKKKLEVLEGIRKNLKNLDSLESIGDIAHVMKSKEKLKKVRTILLATAIPFGIIEWTSILLWIFQGIWWPFALYGLLAIPYVVWLFRFCWRKVSYICPQCHAVFKPSKKEFFFAGHTLTTRKLTCPDCGRKGFCVETGCEEETKEA